MEVTPVVENVESNLHVSAYAVGADLGAGPTSAEAAEDRRPAGELRDFAAYKSGDREVPGRPTPRAGVEGIFQCSGASRQGRSDCSVRDGDGRGSYAEALTRGPVLGYVAALVGHIRGNRAGYERRGCTAIIEDWGCYGGRSGGG